MQYTLVDRNLAGIVLLGSLDCMTTKANLVAAKSHYHGRGQGRCGVVENCHRLNGDHTGADRCEEKDLDAVVPSLWLALHLGFHYAKLSAVQCVHASLWSTCRHPCCLGDSDSLDRVYAGSGNSLSAKEFLIAFAFNQIFDSWNSNCYELRQKNKESLEVRLEKASCDRDQER